jgi:hypothetical protein
MASITFMACSIISGPMPSPANTASLNSMILNF